MRPSWGIRRSAMSRSAMILRREVTAGIRVRGSVSTRRSTPSWRNRICRPLSCGSTWTSLAALVSASIRILSTRLITGEMAAWLLASRSSSSFGCSCCGTLVTPRSRSLNRDERSAVPPGIGGELASGVMAEARVKSERVQTDRSVQAESW